MATKSFLIRGVMKDAVLLRPNTAFEFEFFPTNGLVRFEVNYAEMTGDWNLGSPVSDGAFNGINPISPENTTLRLEDNSNAGRRLFRLSQPIHPLRNLDIGITNPVDPTPPPLPPIPPVPDKDEFEISLYLIGEETPVFQKIITNNSAKLTTFLLTNIPPTPLGFAGPRYKAVFKNISDKNYRCIGRVSYPKIVRVEETIVSLDLMKRLLRQTVEALDFKVTIDGDKIKITVDNEVGALIGKNPLFEYDLPLSLFGHIETDHFDVQIYNANAPNTNITVPTIQINISLEEGGNEIDLGFTGGNLNFSGLNFELKFYLNTNVGIDEWQRDGGIKGNFDRTPYILMDYEFDTDIKLSSDTLGFAYESVNTVIDIINTINVFTDDEIDKIKSLNQRVKDFVNDFLDENILALSDYIQSGLQIIVNKNLEFFGVAVKDGDWSCLSGPVNQNVTIPEGFVPTPTFNFEPIDGPQSPESLANLKRIKHFVILMQENRSFDHVLGYLSHPSYTNDPTYEGLKGPERNRIKNITPDARIYPVQFTKFYPGPPHGHQSVLNQIGDGKMDGFGNEYKKSNKSKIFDPRSIMDFHIPGQLPTYDSIVKNYTVCDHWFCSFPGGTFPNRFCTLSGSTPILDNDDLLEEELMGYVDKKTIFEVLDEENVDWRYYEHDVAFIRLYNKYRLDSENVRLFSSFEQDCIDGLPKVTFIDPNFSDNPLGGIANDDHPGGIHTDMLNGQNLISKIITSLKKSPGWSDTLFLVIYDEHGGLFDHVPPPGSSLSNFDVQTKVHPKCPYMLGARVPAFVISPRAKKGGVVKRIYDHTSFIKSILLNFAPSKVNDLGPRVAEAAHLGDTVPLIVPRLEIPNFKAFSLRSNLNHENLDKDSFHGIMTSIFNPAFVGHETKGRVGITI
jgi:hypothetical protein